MTAATLVRTPSVVEESYEFPHVLDGVVLDGVAARLARMLDRGLLDEAGWDPAIQVLCLPVRHRLLGRQVCRLAQPFSIASTTASSSRSSITPLTNSSRADPWGSYTSAATTPPRHTTRESCIRRQKSSKSTGQSGVVRCRRLDRVCAAWQVTRPPDHASDAIPRGTPNTCSTGSTSPCGSPSR
jgi:hypothetical protein